MKLVFQIAAGVLLAGVVVLGAFHLYHWYTTRSTASSDERRLAKKLMDMGVKACTINSNPAQCLYDLLGECKKFHLNDEDCKQLMSDSVAKVALQKNP